LNVDIKDKNTKILELLEQIEDLKIQIFARDKSISLQTGSVQSLIEELREAK
jgi:hypothetical protein